MMIGRNSFDSLNTPHDSKFGTRLFALDLLVQTLDRQSLMNVEYNSSTTVTALESS
jgi:hypothetical protein